MLWFLIIAIVVLVTALVLAFIRGAYGGPFEDEVIEIASQQAIDPFSLKPLVGTFSLVEVETIQSDGSRKSVQLVVNQDTAATYSKSGLRSFRVNLSCLLFYKSDCCYRDLDGHRDIITLPALHKLLFDGIDGNFAERLDVLQGFCTLDGVLPEDDSYDVVDEFEFDMDEGEVEEVVDDAVEQMMAEEMSS